MPPFPDTHAMSNRAACWMASQDRQTAQRRLEASTEGMSVGNTSPGIAVNVREGRLFSRRRRPFSFLSRNRTTWNCYLVNVGVASLEILLRKHESCRNLRLSSDSRPRARSMILQSLTLLHKLNVAPAYFRKYTYTAMTTRITVRIQ